MATIINGKELAGRLGSYEFVESTNSYESSKFNCVINPYITPIDFYTDEEILTYQSYDDTYYITLKFDENYISTLPNVQKLIFNTSFPTEQGYYYSAPYGVDSVVASYRQDSNTFSQVEYLCDYDKNISIYLTSWNGYQNESEINTFLSIQKDDSVMVEFDLKTEISNAVKNGSYTTDEWGNNKISIEQDGYKIGVQFVTASDNLVELFNSIFSIDLSFNYDESAESYTINYQY